LAGERWVILCCASSPDRLSRKAQKEANRAKERQANSSQIVIFSATGTRADESMSDEIGVMPRILDNPQGFSVSPGGRRPWSGYMVAMQGRTTLVNPAAVTSVVIADHIKQNADVYSDPDTHIGAWHHEGKIYLEPAQHVRDFGQACRLGKERDQIAIWDLRKNSVVFL
jgi:hypothetical protein